MKKIFIHFLLLFIFTEIKSQSTTENKQNAEAADNSGCVNNTNTDWNNPSPQVNNFRKNTFDWSTPNFSSAYKVGNAFSFGSLTNPYFTTTSYYPFANSANPDLRPEDGWELVKQDFGYFYNGNWQGNLMGNNPIVSNDPRLTPSYINYLLLYNKFSSTLRVMTFIQNTDNTNTINVRLRFLTSSDFSGNTYQPVVNGLFNSYNKYQFALDKQTNVTEISAPAVLPTNNTGEMIYADFHLSYDPCLCYFQSGLHIDFFSIKSANLTATGKYAGINTTIPYASITNGSGSVFGTSPGEPFINSIWNNGGSPQSVVSSYQNLDKLYQESLVSNNVLVKNSISLLKTELSLVGYVVPAFKPALQAGSSVLDFLSTYAVPKTPTKPDPNLNVTTGYMSISGSVINEPNAYNSYNIRIGVPGSKDASTLPEYAPVTNGGQVLPNYPTYNEPLGIFALLKTPVIKEFRNIPNGSINLFCNTDGNGGATCNAWYGQPPSKVDFTADNFLYFKYQPKEDLLYKLNPIMDVAKTKVYIGYEIEGMPLNFSGQLSVGDFYRNELIGGLDFIEPTDRGIDVQFYERKFERYRTKFYSVGCNTSIVTQEKYSYDFPSSGYITNGPQTYINTLLANNFSRIHNQREVKLVVLIDGVTLPDAHGNVNYPVQILKFNCEIEQSPSDFTSSGSGLNSFNALNLPTDLVINQTSYNSTSPTTIYSWGKISILGDQSNISSTGNDVKIIAENEIQVTGEVKINTTSANINLKIQTLPDFFNNCSNLENVSLSNESLTSYCTDSYNGNKYMANQPSAKSGMTIRDTVTKSDSIYINTFPISEQTNNQRLKTDMNVADDNIYNFNLALFPNPSTGIVILGFSTQIALNSNIVIEDLLGRNINTLSFKFEKGYTQNQIDLSELANGIYIVKILYDNGDFIKSEKIVLSR